MNDIKLFHGSKSGIHGQIQPTSRKKCDFGKGFYMGTNIMQASTLIYNKENPILYEMKIELSKIPNNRILTLSDREWLYYVLYNRGVFNEIRNTPLYEQISQMDKGKDFIIGPIADDNLMQSINEFMKNGISDEGIIACLQCISYGTQYVAKTEEACKHITILSEQKLDKNRISEYHQYQIDRKNESQQKVIQIKEQYFGKGKLLSQIINEEKQKI